MSISEFCNRNVIGVAGDTPVIEAAALMRQHHVGDVIVVEEVHGQRKPVGIVTDRDLVVEVMASGLDPRQLKVSDLVSGPVVTIDEGASYAQTVGLMSVKGIRRMPVVGRAGELIGIITLDDILWQLAAPLAALAGLSERGRTFEAKTRK